MATSEEKSGGGTVGKLWRKHGGGYYALLVIGTFLYLEFTSLVDSIRGADSVQDFLLTEARSFAIESFFNALMASFWPFMWFRWMGTNAIYWALGGYAVWATLIAVALHGREKKLRKELGL